MMKGVAEKMQALKIQKGKDLVLLAGTAVAAIFTKGKLVDEFWADDKSCSMVKVQIVFKNSHVVNKLTKLLVNGF